MPKDSKQAQTEASFGASPGTAKETLVDRAYRQVKQGILSNHYPPNLQVLEQDLAGQLSMSRTPVREALIRLEKEGLVQILPRRGMRVLPLTPQDVRDIYEVLICLEAAAARRLAERAPSAAEVAPMIEAMETMEAAVKAGDLVTWALADDRFHRQLLALSGNPRLEAVALTVFDQAHRARMTTLHMRPPPRESNAEHRALVDAVLAGDAAQAFTVHQGHRVRAMELLAKILERHDLQVL